MFKNKKFNLDKNYDNGLSVINEVTMEQKSGIYTPVKETE